MNLVLACLEMQVSHNTEGVDCSGKALGWGSPLLPGAQVVAPSICCRKVLGRTDVDCLWPGLRETRHGEVGFPEDLRTSAVLQPGTVGGRHWSAEGSGRAAVAGNG